MITLSRHPTYDEALYAKFRRTKRSGRAFIDYYLEPHEKEADAVFRRRKAISYCPAFAREAVLEVAHAMYLRMNDVTRESSSSTYLTCVEGENGGVDGEGSSMTNFMGRKVLEELLFMGKVGVFIDSVSINGPTKADVKGHPYCYIYTAENIYNWAVDPNNPEFLTALLLRDMYPELNEYGLPVEIKPRYRLYRVVDEGINVTLFNSEGVELPYFENGQTATKILKLKHIPFCLVDLGISLLQDVADYQIAHLNLASSDLWYAWAANFPFYVEQFDPMDQPFIRNKPERATDFEPPPGFSQFASTEEELVAEVGGANITRPRLQRAPQNDAAEITVGPSTGRRYPRGMERPSFIHPSSEPLKAAIQKEEQLKFEIRQLVSLAVSNLQAKMVSAESKKLDYQGLEAGLAFVGLACETGERFILKAWHEYEGLSDANGKIIYPEQYNLKSDDERRKDAEEMRTLQTAVTSRSFQKRVQKDITRILYGSRLPINQLEQFDKEIDIAKAPTADPIILQQDHEAGFVSDKTASMARGYEKGEAEQAAKDHAERLARIKSAQTASTPNPGARGLADEAVTPNQDAKDEKTNSQNHYLDKSGRGEGNNNG